MTKEGHRLKEYLKSEVFDGKSPSLIQILRVFFFGSGSLRALFLYRCAKVFHDSGSPRLSRFFFLKLERVYGVQISLGASIGIGLKLPHPNGIVIGCGVRVGNDVTIFQQVTIGGARIGDAQESNYPVIGDRTVLSAGSKVLGAIEVGENCTIGANAVVVVDVPSNHVAVGVPARNIPR